MPRVVLHAADDFLSTSPYDSSLISTDSSNDFLDLIGVRRDRIWSYGSVIGSRRTLILEQDELVFFNGPPREWEQREHCQKCYEWGGVFFNKRKWKFSLVWFPVNGGVGARDCKLHNIMSVHQLVCELRILEEVTPGVTWHSGEFIPEDTYIGTDPEALAKAVKDELKTKLDTASRKARRKGIHYITWTLINGVKFRIATGDCSTIDVDFIPTTIDEIADYLTLAATEIGLFRINKSDSWRNEHKSLYEKLGYNGKPPSQFVIPSPTCKEGRKTVKQVLLHYNWLHKVDIKPHRGEQQRLTTVKDVKELLHQTGQAHKNCKKEAECRALWGVPTIVGT